jgi:hydrogenase/urease accessory protein HupE
VVELTFAGKDLAGYVSGVDQNKDGDLDSHEATASRGRVKEAIVDGIAVSSDGSACPGELREVKLVEKDGVLLSAEYRCPRAGSFVADHAFIAELGVGHRHIANEAVLSRKERELFVAPGDSSASASAPAPAPSLSGMVKLGIEHILIGWDHLLFLFGLVLIGGRWQSLALAITAFTIGHSVTLALAALSIWSPSPSIIEPAIALSIAYVGVENWYLHRAPAADDEGDAGDRGAAKRWRITAPFGLIHGFGFAGALGEITLDRSAIPRALFGFNLGVEIGQLAVLALVLPVLAAFRNKRWLGERQVIVLSGAIALTGAGLFVARVWG